MKYSSRRDTKKHIWQVRKNIGTVVWALIQRAVLHDKTKLHTPEKDFFDEFTPKLAGSTYGSGEYKRYLIGLKAALDHHYALSRHHPEHFENGIRGMNLIDIVEMFCDWYAATKRHNDGDMMKSIEINKGRFGYSDDLRAIFENTYKDIFQDE
jgi:hypothetical protein